MTKVNFDNFAIIYTKSTLEATLITWELMNWIDPKETTVFQNTSLIYFYTTDPINLFTIDIVLQFKMYYQHSTVSSIKDGWLYMTNYYV